MRQVSNKRRELMKKVKPIRDALRSEVGCCEICGTQRGMFEIHEIARGHLREACLGERCALLVVCRNCHDEKLSQALDWPETRQLAVLANSRPLDFNLAQFLSITSPNAPRRIEIKEVAAWLPTDYLTKQDVAERLQVDRRSVQNWIDSGQLPAIDARTTGASRPLYRVALSDYRDFCKARRVSDTSCVESQNPLSD